MLLKFYFFLFLFFSFSFSLSAQKQFEGLKEINGTKLYLKVIGKGEPLLILHGGPGMGFSYLYPYLESLAEKNTLIFFDQRSSGRSELSLKEHMNFKSFAADIDSIRRFLGYDKMHILGHSWGSLLAVYYGAHYQKHLQSLILCNPVPLYFGDNKQFLQNQRETVTEFDSTFRAQLLSSKEFESGNTVVVEKLMKLNFKSFFCDTLFLNELHLNLAENYVVASLSLYGFSNDLYNYDFIPALKTIHVPIYLLNGACDLVPKIATQKVISNSETETFFEFSQSGQFPFIEEKKLFTRKIKKFLRKNKE